ncbi:MAG: ribonucleoside triphosphate reductase [Lachnospiraceae bacterium]|nr:ribonucleoside triphosphate reductase [Lachnospiraceae bacterium]
MIQVAKRDGELRDFDLQKICGAIEKAFKATQKEYTDDIINLLALRVTSEFQSKVKDGVVEVEDIQDCVEHVLESTGYTDVAKAYILYRKNREKMRNMKSTILDYKEIVNSYVHEEDWRVKENATVTYSVGGLILHNSGAITANYWLSEVYDPEIANAHKNADIHIHDLSMLTGYCAGWSLKQLIKEGLGGIRGKMTSSPARHLSTLVNQMVNFLGIMQNEWAGAQAFSSFDTYLAPFVKVDNLSYKEVKQCIQSFVYGVNTPSRWGTQAPFSNITLDWTVPADMAELPCLIGGEEMDFCYKDCKKEMDMVNKAFIEIMIEGDANGRGFQYPIPTYSITRDFDWSDNENNRLLFEMTAKYGTPYFSNYINSDMQPSDVRSMCCRLRLDLRELRKKTGGFFGSGESTGSIGVVTINMPRLAYLATDEDDFYKRLDHMMDIAARSLKVKRTVITRLMNEGLYPYTKRYLGTFENHFSTIGLLGMNEAGLNAKWIGKDMTTQECQDFSVRVLNHMRERLSDYQEQYGDLYNLEATPAESTSYRLAKHDKKHYPDIITAGKDGETPYYTNSSHLPVGYTADVFDALDIQDRLQTLYTSGTVFHCFLGEKLPDWQAAAKLVRTIAENYQLPYYTMSPTYSICQTHGYITGEVDKCPECGAPTEIYSRITGYYRAVQNWNPGKQQEFKERLEYVIDDGKLNHGIESAEEAQEVVERSMPEPEPAPEIPVVNENGELLLFTTKTCPNCKLAKEFLSGMDYKVVDAEENAKLTMKYGVMQAPTLVVLKGENVEKYTNASNIRRFVNENR